MMLLTLLIFTPIIGSIIVYFAGIRNEKLCKALTILISAFTVAVTLFLFLAFN